MGGLGLACVRLRGGLGETVVRLRGGLGAALLRLDLVVAPALVQRARRMGRTEVHRGPTFASLLPVLLFAGGAFRLLITFATARVDPGKEGLTTLLPMLFAIKLCFTTFGATPCTCDMMVMGWVWWWW